jgi:carbonic anhydrase/acetyltransferase-like protein (isoleucine patch superfamily)
LPFVTSRTLGQVNRLLADGLVAAWCWAARAGTVGPESRHARRFAAVGAGTAFVFPPGVTMGQRWIQIGQATLVGPGVVLSAGMWPDEPLAPEAGWVVRIGNRCNLGRGTSLIGRVGIDVGDDVTFGPGVYVTDHNHDYAHPRVPISHQWVVEAPVRIGPGCWFGVGAVVLPGASIGSHVAVAAGSVVRGEIPDRCVIAGSPARVVRRWNEDRGNWDPPLPPGRGIAGENAPPGWIREPAEDPLG